MYKHLCSLAILVFSVLCFACAGKDPKVIVPPAELDTNNNKISDKLEEQINQKYLSTDGKIPVAIALKKNPENIPYIASMLGNKGINASATSTLVYAFFANLDEQTVRNLAKMEDVVFIEENAPIKAHLFFSTKQIGARRAWASSYKGQYLGGTSTNIRLGVIDTGVDVSNNDFSGKIVKSVDCYNANCTDTTVDDQGHGSHVAGIMLGNGTNGENANDFVYYEISGTFSSTQNAGTPHYFPVYIGSSLPGAPNNYLNAKLTWGNTTVKNGYAILTKANAIGNGSTSDSYSGTITGSVPGTGAGEYITKGAGWTALLDDTSLLNSVSAYAVIGYEDSTSPAHNASGTSYWAQVQSIIQSHGDGENRMNGVSPGSQLVSAKALDSQGSSSVNVIILALDYMRTHAQDYGIIAVNMSFGVSGGTASPLLDAAATNLNDAGVMIIVSAGNEQGSYYINSPGDAPKALTVGAVNEKDEFTNYSSVGNPYATVKKPDVLAPGGSTNTKVYISAPKTGNLGYWHNTYALKVGTSQASPHVTGLAGLLAGKHSGAWQYGSSAYPAFFKMLICMTAYEVGKAESDATNTPSTPERAGGLKDNVEGYGRISVDGAMGALDTWDFNSGALNFTFGDNVYDVKTIARAVYLDASKAYNFYMNMPSDADYDLYLFSAAPDTNGDPVLLTSSALVSKNPEQIIDFIPTASGFYYIVGKWVSGSGAGSISLASERALPGNVVTISNLRVDKSMRDKKIYVSWNTNIAATSLVQYGTVGGLGSEITDANYVTDHMVTLSFEYGSYFYVRVLSSSSPTSDPAGSFTAVSPVYRQNVSTTLEKQLSPSDLPTTDAGGCGRISKNTSGGDRFNLISLLLMLLAPLFLIFRRIMIS